MIKLREITPIKLSGISSFSIEFSFNQELVTAIKTIQNAIWHKKLLYWEIPATSLSAALDLLVYFDDIELELAADTVHSTINNLTEEEIRSFKIKPFPHQIEAINFGLRDENHKWLLLDGMGLG